MGYTLLGVLEKIPWNHYFSSKHRVGSKLYSYLIYKLTFVLSLWLHTSHSLVGKLHARKNLREKWDATILTHMQIQAFFGCIEMLFFMIQ